MVTNAVYLVMYGVFRLSIVPWILHVFGTQTGHSSMEAFLKLRMSCRVGTATIGILNSIWFIRKFVRRYQRKATPRKGMYVTHRLRVTGNDSPGSTRIHNQSHDFDL